MRLTSRAMATMSFVASCIAALPAGAQWWNPQSPIAPGKWEAESRTFVYTRNIYSSAVQVIIAAVQQGDFAKLDRMHDEFLKMTQAGGNGSRMINAFQEALSTFGKDHLERQQAFLKAWHAGAPTSKLWPAAQAQMWFSAAWDERGGGFASEVSPEAMRLFGQDLERASQALQEGGDAARQSPLWYAVAIAVAGSRGEGSRSLDALFEEGVKRFPHFTLQYNARLIYLLPQWGGSYDRADAFIRRAVMDTQADDGTWMYADLYASAGRMVQGDFFRDTRASWPLMRHAFEDASARGLANPNTYATYACMARDRETTRRLLGELGTYANLGMGRDTFTTESCRAMVEEGK